MYVTRIALFVLLSFAFARGARGNTTTDDLRKWLAQPRDDRPTLSAQGFAKEPLTKADAGAAQSMLWADHVAEVRADRQKEWDGKAITIGGHTLKFLSRSFGARPAGGWNLFISMHGGGGAPKAVNDQQWQNQIRLYQPPNSLYIAPRAPTDDWDLWHKDHIDPLFDRLIDDAVVLAGANPNRVYLMGYSAGGDGVYQLAPRMADRWAAASMMAGHPNDASPLPLRNLPFTIHVGALDAAYHRNDIAAEWGQKLDDLQKDDPKGYVHWVHVHDGRAHWMNLEDAEAVPWMLKSTRDPLPQKVVWMQDDVTHDQLYWLAVEPGSAKKGQLAIASRSGQTITIDKVDGGLARLTVLLNDKMLDLDRPVTIRFGGRDLFSGIVHRTAGDLARSLAVRGDPTAPFAAAVTVDLANGG